MGDTEVQWWCSAQGIAWDWSWRPYPGVWLFLAALVGVEIWLGRATAGGGAPFARARGAAFAAGIVLLWLALDWPVGPLGAGYLASVHTVQYLLIALLAPPLLLLGTPHRGYARLIGRPRAHRVLRSLTTPALALPAFSLVAAVTHVPWVVDRLMVSQLGSFAIDMAWLGTGLMFWWPVVAPLPVRPRFHPPLQLLYLFPTTLVHSGIAAFLVFSRFPVYATYELAPPTGWFTALDDQQIAGGLMWLMSTPFILSVMGIVFFRWTAREEEAESGSSWLTPSRENLLPPRRA
jgi:putative membrane protein